MSQRVFNVTTKCHLKLGQAKNWVADGSYVWVESLRSIRKLNLRERIAMRSEIARRQEPIAHAEIPGLRYEPAPQNLASTRQSYAILKQANQFCIEHA